MEGIIAMILLLLVKETPCAQAQHGFPAPSRNYMSRPQQAHALAAGLLSQEAPTPVKLISHSAVLRQDVDFHLLTRKMEALNTFQGQIAEKFENVLFVFYVNTIVNRPRQIQRTINQSQHQSKI